MAYLDTRPQQNRTAIIGIVAVIHGLAAYAIVTGLAHKYTREVMTIIEAHNVPAELPSPKPPPEPPKTDPTPQEHKVVQPPERPFDVPLGNVDAPPIGPSAGDQLIDLPRADPPPPTDVSKFKPQGVRASNDRASWATTNDYPAGDLRQGNQGITGFKLIVGTNGKVTDCLIAKSSGYAGLDAATCKNVSRRARFKPATDGNGQPTTGEYAGTIRWVIPE